MLDDAIRTFEKTHDLVVNRTVKSLNALLFSCVLAKNYGEVKRIFLEFPRKYGIEPDLGTYNTILKSFCESGLSSFVYLILSEMERKGVKPNVPSFEKCVAGFYREEKYDDVGKVLELMKKHDMTPGISIYNIRIQSLCKLRRSVEAKALVDGMLSRGMKPNAVTEGNLDEAKSFLNKMVNSGFKLVGFCYFTLVDFLCQGEDFETALKISKKSMKNGWVPNFSTMKSLVNGLASISKVDEAREITRQMKEKFSKVADKWTEIEENLPK
ncbi:unnamed protein product [Ilex paraguariensis]|uniref:Pentatricopeptide repeat-containing protein n=1 Tax=Ilex paraguariensis TaxID=185542 RepID=A0ABC8U6L2_9AQUA